MSDETIIRLARLTDGQVVELFRKLEEEMPDGDAHFRGPNNLRIELEDIEDDTLFTSSLIFREAYISSDDWDLRVIYRRGVSNPNSGNRSPSAYFDEVQIATVTRYHANESDATFENLIKLSRIIERYGTVVQPSGDVNNFSGATDIISAEVSKLAQLASELTAGADETRRELERERIAQRKEHEAHKASLDVAHQERLAALAEDKQALEVLRQELDDREHKHVRRQLRETITQDLNEDITAPKSFAKGLRYSALSIALCLFGVLGLGVLAVQTQGQISSLPLDTVRAEVSGEIISSKLSSSPQVYLLYLKLFTVSGAGFGLLMYTISMLRRMSTDRITHQQQLQKYVFDINRASWTIETILELSEAGLDEVPDVWLNSVTHNLFTQDGATKEDASSLQSLAALLNVTSEAEIGPEGPKFKLNRRGAKQAAAELAN